MNESKANFNRKQLHSMLKDKGYSLKRSDGKHDIWGHDDTTKPAVSVPRNYQGGSYSPGVAHKILKTLGEKEKLVIGKNKSGIKIHPKKDNGVKEQILESLKKLTETKADKNTDYYDEKTLGDVRVNPYSYLNDPDAPSSLKDLAYRTIMFQIDEKVILKKDIVTKGDAKAYKDGHAEGKKWVKDNPVHHQNIIDHWNKATPDEKKFGENWYSDAHHMTKHIANDTGINMHKMAGLVANYSPQTHWATNMITASKVARTKEAVGGPGSGVFASMGQKQAAHRILNGEDYNHVLSGHKIKSFAHLIEHGGNKYEDTPHVVVDRHAYSVAAGKRISDAAFGHSGLKSKKKYNEVSNHYHEAAKHISAQEGRPIAAHQVQAATWLVRQRLNEGEDRAASKTSKSKVATTAINQNAKWDAFRKEHHPKLGGDMPGVGYSKQ